MGAEPSLYKSVPRVIIGTVLFCSNSNTLNMKGRIFCCFLLFCSSCWAQQHPLSNVRLSYSAPDSHYVVEDRSVDGTSVLGNFGYQSSDGKSVGVAYGNDGAGFVIGTAAVSDADQMTISGSGRPQQPPALKPVTTTETPVVIIERGHTRPPALPAAAIPLDALPVSIPVSPQAHVSTIDDMITQLDDRQSTSSRRKNRRRKQRRQRPRS